MYKGGKIICNCLVVAKGAEKMKVKRIITLISIMCFVFGSMSVHAETKGFDFFMAAGACDAGNWTASKADSEQRAYVTPVTISGTGRIWAEVYSITPHSSVTSPVGIQNGEANVTKTTPYNVTGVAGQTYRICACDSEYEVTSKTFKVTGRWTP